MTRSKVTILRAQSLLFPRVSRTFLEKPSSPVWVSTRSVANICTPLTRSRSIASIASIASIPSSVTISRRLPANIDNGVPRRILPELSTPFCSVTISLDERISVSRHLFPFDLSFYEKYITVVSDIRRSRSDDAIRSTQPRNPLPNIFFVSSLRVSTDKLQKAVHPWDLSRSRTGGRKIVIRSSRG